VLKRNKILSAYLVVNCVGLRTFLLPLVGGVSDIVNRVKFHQNRFGGSYLPEGSKSAV